MKTISLMLSCWFPLCLSALLAALLLASGAQAAPAATSGNTAQSPHDLAMRIDLLGDQKLAQGDHVAALANYREARNIRMQWWGRNANDTMAFANVIISFKKIVNAQQAQGDFTAALASNQLLQNALAQKLAPDPLQKEWQYETALCLLKTGDIQLAQGDRSAALKSYDSARTLLTVHPTRKRGKGGPAHWTEDAWEADLATINTKIGDLRENGDDAVRSYEFSIAYLKRQVKLNLLDTQLPLDLERLEARLAQVKANNAAITTAQEKRYDSSPPQPGIDMTAALELERHGEQEAAQGKYWSALSDYRKANDIWKKLVDATPGNDDLMRHWLGCHLKIGTVETLRDDRRGALIIYRHAQTIAKTLRHSNKPEWQVMLVDIEMRMVRLNHDGLNDASRDNMLRHSYQVLHDLQKQQQLPPQGQTLLDNLMRDFPSSLYLPRPPEEDVPGRKAKKQARLQAIYPTQSLLAAPARQYTQTRLSA